MNDASNVSERVGFEAHQASTPSGDLNKNQIATERIICWPRDLLSPVLPRSQVFTWGYDADIDHFTSAASTSSVHQHATNLLADISYERTTPAEKKLPIIFICHGLGGIVVKDALNQSRQMVATQYKDVAPATIGVCFLGTPHRGSNVATLGKYAYTIRSMQRAFKGSSTSLLRSLERNSDDLDRISQYFAQTATHLNYKLCSFREEQAIKRFWIFGALIVDSDSAQIGFSHEEVNSIPANHIEMTKLVNEDDVGFKRVSRVLRGWVEALAHTEHVEKDVGG